MAKSLNHWLCNVVGEKNLKKWKRLSETKYQKIIQIISLAVLPALEKLSLLSIRCEALVVAIALPASGHMQELEYFDSLKRTTAALCNQALNITQKTSEEEKKCSVFILWIQDLIFECVDEDYVPKLNICEDGSVVPTLMEIIDQFFQDTTKEKSTDGTDLSKNLLKSISDTLENIDSSYVRNMLLKTMKIRGTARSFTENFDEDVTILDIFYCAKYPFLVYLVEKRSNTQDVKASVKYIGTANSINLRTISAAKKVNYPLSIDSASIQKVKFLFEKQNNCLTLISTIQSLDQKVSYIMTEVSINRTGDEISLNFLRNDTT